MTSSIVQQVRPDYYLSLQDAHLFPLVAQQPNPDICIGSTLDVLDIQQLVFPTKGQKVGKKRIKVGFGAEVEDLWVVRVVYVGKYAEELTVDVFDGRGKGLGKVVTCDGVSRGHRVFRGRT